MKVAIIGTVGVPACYGGYETLVENMLDSKQNEQIEYQIYCSSRAYASRTRHYKGARLVYIPLQANGWQAIFYDTLSLIHAYFTCDQILSLGTVGCFILPVFKCFSKKPIYINLDGLDNKRAKFSSFSQRIIGLARRIAAKYATRRISDNQAIQTYVRDIYKKDSVLIEYGGDNAFIVKDDEKLMTRYGLAPGSYCFKVARIEPENNIELILEAFSRLPQERLVVVGNWQRSTFGQTMRSHYGSFPNIRLLDPIYDPQEINLLRSNCKLYLHGHSAGGTNPSLVEAMYLGLPILAYDVIYNRCTTEDQALYFQDAKGLEQLVAESTEAARNALAGRMKEIAERRYRWAIICAKYEALFQ